MSLTLPKEFSFVDLSDKAFESVLEECVNGDDNLVIQSPAGAGKSLMIRVVASMIKNCVVLSPTGLTALNLCCDGVKAFTPHSFFCLPPVAIIPTGGQHSYIPRKNVDVIKSASTIIIDEISMVGNQMLDVILSKILTVRNDLPRILLFGDLMQLPPVVDMRNEITRDYYAKNYDNKLMFFHSKHYKELDFRTMSLHKVYRQADPELKKRLIEVGYNEFDQSTLDYFNQRVMPLTKFDTTHPLNVRLAPTNAIVNAANAEYIKNHPGKSRTYKAESYNWKGLTPNDESVTLKVGIQVMCVVNNYDLGDKGCNYRNGTIGVVRELHPEYVVIETTDGSSTRVVQSTVAQYEAVVNSVGLIDYKVTGHFRQIGCKPMRAMTIHKSQGKQFDNAYIQLTGYTSPGLLYVALSRVMTLDGIGLSRPLKLADLVYNQESFEFLEFGGVEEQEEETIKEDENALVGS
jgi:hypothetical protein